MTLAVTRVHHPDPACLDLLAAFDAQAFGPTGLRSYDLAVMAEAGAVFVARIGEDIVGGFQLLRVLDEPAFLYVVGFYLRPAWRGRGLGRELLAAMRDEARGLGAEGVLLTVSPGNTRASELYRKAGFAEEAFVPAFYGEGEDRFILRWRFEEPLLPGSV